MAAAAQHDDLLARHHQSYQAGLSIDFVQSEPFWFCTGCTWRFRAQPMPRRKTGNNKIEADRSFAAHVAGLR